MNNITLGKYVPYNSFIHRLDPRSKLLSMIVLMVCIFFKFASVAMNFLMYGVLFIFIYIIMRIAHIKLRMLFSQLKAMWVMIIILLIINILVKGDPSMGTIDVFNTGWIIYYSAIYNTLYIVFRLIIMLGLTLVLTATTKPLELTNALEWFMAPLKVIHFPVHEIAMTISLALRFIPTLLEETDRIMKAQASRGVDFQNGKFSEKIRAIISLIVPLFISALQRSEELANAMEARGYDPSAKRTKYRVSKWKVGDTISSLVVLLILGGCIALMVTKLDLVSLIISLFMR
ncbi:MAG: energy-coupling factor transporter transmembrane protein EcfT [Erysipelotrichaceae bacterium]|nr:energy-coupling factor transporter transmembrane protein EcfT [Erysipelotrichaceae bacterium]